MSSHSDVSTSHSVSDAADSLLDRAYFPIFVLAIAFLAFIVGAFVVFSKVFPYSYLNEAYQGASALLNQQTQYNTPYKTDLWRDARTDQRGTTIYNPAKAFNGFTLYTSSHAQKAFLISMEGEVVHEWALPVSAIWEDEERKPRPDGFIFWDDVQMTPNGDLLAMIVGIGDTPWGYGLVKMDKDSNVIWKYMDHVHHDLDVAADGTIYVLTNEIRQNRIEGFEHLDPPRIDDSVVVLSPDGQPIKKVSIIDALARSPYGRMLHAIAWNIQGDILHTNSIDVIGAREAEKLPFASEGQVLLSLRDIDALAVLDLNTEEIVWAMQGSWHRQHDADVLSNGNFLLFDNFGHYEAGGTSRVIELNPSTSEFVWTYTGDEKHFFQSDIRSGQDRLPNGNTLIAESDGGRLFEVTPEGEIVWEYINPVRAGDAEDLIPVFSRAKRLGPDELDPGFLESVLQASGPDNGQPSG